MLRSAEKLSYVIVVDSQLMARLGLDVCQKAPNMPCLMKIGNRIRKAPRSSREGGEGESCSRLLCADLHISSLRGLLLSMISYVSCTKHPCVKH